MSSISFRRSSLSPGLLAALLLSACSSPAPLGRSSPWEPAPVTGPSPGDIRPTLRADDRTLAAADPSLPGFDGWPLLFTASVPAGADFSCDIVVARGSSVVSTLEGTVTGGTCAATWNGLEDGVPARPGALSVTATLTNTAGDITVMAVQTMEVVRAGIDRIELTGERSPLLYRRTGGRRGDFSEITATEPPFLMGADASETGATAIELASGERRETPSPWNDVLTPPLDGSDPDGLEADTLNLPSAVVAATDVTLEARLTTLAAGDVSGDPVVAEVRLVPVEGFTITGEDTLADGNVLTIEHPSSPVPGVGRFDVTYAFTLEARRPGGSFQAMPGELAVTLRYYGLVGTPMFYGTSVPHRTWVDVIDRIAEWVGGETADPTEVGGALVEGVYYDLGLRYDTARGASFYTDYARSNFGEQTFDMQAFEERENGDVINCSDAASILSSYANMVGLDFRYHILTHRSGTGFDLNYIQAIGGTRFDDTPFDSGRGGFSYHAIVGDRDTMTWDATLAVDGDGSPGSTPNTLMLVQRMVPFDYLEALSSEASQISTTHDERVRIR